MPKISIIVIVYRVERFLEKCLESIIAQTYENLEIICVVGTGDEQCEKICDRFAASDPRIIVIKEKPAGTAAARNTGLNAAGGDYIAFVDGDDYIDCDMIETMVNAAVKEDADISVVGKYYAYENVIEGTPASDNEEMILDRKSSYEMILLENGFFLHIWDKLYRRSLFDGLRFTPGKKVEDRQMVRILLGRADRIVYNTASKYYFRVSADSGSKVADNLSLSLEADRIIVDEMLAEYPELKKSSKFFLTYETISVIQSSMLYGTFSTLNNRSELNYVRRHAFGVLFNRDVPLNIKAKVIMCAFTPHIFARITIKRRADFLANHKEYSTGNDWNKTFSEQNIK